MKTPSHMAIAVCQIDAGTCLPSQQWQWLCQQVEDAKRQNVQLIIFSELFTTSYNVGTRLHTEAQPSHGDFSQQVQRLAQEHGIAIVYGYSERDNGHVYNAAAQLIDANSTLLANHCKSVLPDGIEPDWFAICAACGWNQVPPNMMPTRAFENSVFVAYANYFWQ